MGFYVNPRSEDKERFLAREGVKVQMTDVNMIWERCPPEALPVVWVNNELFTAAGVAHTKDELEAFLNPGDGRQKRVYYVHIADLLPVTTPAPMFEDMLRRLGKLPAARHSHPGVPDGGAVVDPLYAPAAHAHVQIPVSEEENRDIVESARAEEFQGGGGQGGGAGASGSWPAEECRSESSVSDSSSSSDSGGSCDTGSGGSD